MRIVLVGVLVAVMFACGSGTQVTDTPGDVLIVTLDTARVDRFSYAGPSPVTTPSIDRVGSEGAAFLAAIAPAPITLVSHASLFTGKNPYQHGVHNNGDFALAPEAVTLAEVFSAHGWVTAAFIGATVLDGKYGLDQGFSTYDDQFSGTDTMALMAYVRRPADEVVNAALSWLRGAPPGPTFAWVHLYDAHAPYEPPEPERSRYPDAYDGAIAFVDRMVGRLLDGYRETGRWERALVVVVADHGESLGEHKERTHGVFIYDATLRIPLVMRGPGITPGTRVTTPVALIDIMPTVLGLVGLEMPPSIAGRDLRPLLDGEGRSDIDRAIYVESLLPELNFGWSPLRGFRTDQWKYIRGADAELYDLESDPDELENVALKRPDVVKELSQKLDTTLASEGATTATDLEIDEAERARLAALGYISYVDREESVRDGEELPDPRERVVVLNRMHDAMTRFSEGDADGAIADLELLLKDEPDNPSAVATLGSLRFRIGDYTGAAAAYGRAARLAPRHANYSELEALALERLGRFEEALTATERALAAEPSRASARDIRWRLLARTGRNAQVIQETEKVLAKNPGDGMARVLLEQATHGHKPSAELVAAFESALQDLPGNLPVTAALADAVFGMGDEARAELLYRQVLEKQPDNLNAALRVGQQALAEGRISDARGVIEIGARYHHDSAAIQVLVARLRMATGEYAEARKALVMAYRLRPGWAETWLAAGELGFLEGLPDQSAANLDRAAAAAGDDPGLWDRIARANRRLGRETEAAAADARARRGGS